MGGRVKSTWNKGEKPPVQRPKGSKNKKTLLKESLGLSNWEKLKSFIEHEGAEKMVDQLLEVKGSQFLTAFNAVSEFIKPKLSRREFVDEGPPKANINYADLPKDLKKQVLDHFRRNHTKAPD